jgi:hypothetical protein
MSSLVDPAIKFHALRGLGNIVFVEREEANKYAQTVLDALTSAIDDPNESIAMEGMNGLAKVQKSISISIFSDFFNFFLFEDFRYCGRAEDVTDFGEYLPPYSTCF